MLHSLPFNAARAEIKYLEFSGLISFFFAADLPSVLFAREIDLGKIEQKEQNQV